jgi:O-methyltransferase domain
LAAAPWRPSSERLDWSITIFDVPEAINDMNERWASKLGCEDRCRHVGGDMFKEVPSADAYSLKMIQHDWNDECRREDLKHTSLWRSVASLLAKDFAVVCADLRGNGRSA